QAKSLLSPQTKGSGSEFVCRVRANDESRRKQHYPVVGNKLPALALAPIGVGQSQTGKLAGCPGGGRLDGEVVTGNVGPKGVGQGQHSVVYQERSQVKLTPQIVLGKEVRAHDVVVGGPRNGSIPEP